MSDSFPELVRGRRQQIEDSLQHAASGSTSSALLSLLKDWCQGRVDQNIFSLAVQADGSYYDIPSGLVCSVPVRFKEDGGFEVVKDLKLSQETREQIAIAVAELQTEIDTVLNFKA